jgi:transcriptional regulator with XRE-family HTH domain
MEQSKKLFPNKLRHYRREFGFKLKDVAYLIEVQNPADIGCWERGRKMPSTLNLLKLCALYRASPDFLYQEYTNALKRSITERERLYFQR